ncbi:MAG: radical SAM protein [Chitinophagia bacterium]|nr:radical SAM protein [Chitinophagia bacterium]
MHNDLAVSYPIMEHFYTLQGEGAFAGYAAYFIRLGGCDVGCVWCDVKESWDAAAHPQVTVATLLNYVLESKTNRVVITGGEPCMYDLHALCNALHAHGLKVHLETSGAHEIRGNFDWITLSPKKFKAPLASAYAKADELKIIVFNKHDFDWAREHQALVPAKSALYLQTEWEKRDSNYNLIIDFIKANPAWHLSIQTHKYLEIP